MCVLNLNVVGDLPDSAYTLHLLAAGFSSIACFLKRKMKENNVYHETQEVLTSVATCRTAFSYRSGRRLRVFRCRCHRHHHSIICRLSSMFKSKCVCMCVCVRWGGGGGGGERECMRASVGVSCCF